MDNGELQFESLTAIDVVLGVLSLPLLVWVLMWAVTGGEQLIFLRRTRRRIMLALIIIEVMAVASIVWWVTA